MCENLPLANFTTMRVGGHSKIYLLTSPAQLKCLDDANLILGLGSNVLIADSGVEKTVVNRLWGVSETQNGFVVYSGEKLGSLCSRAKVRALGGLEWACSIPATIGGAIATNAGAFGGEMANVVEWVEVYRDGKIDRLSAKDCSFCYRNSKIRGFIVRAKINLYPQNYDEICRSEEKFRHYRQKTQPQGHSAGSIFKRADLPAGYYIERAGLKGKRVGGAIVSNKHANFIINDGTATAGQVYELIKIIEQTVEKEFGVKLEREIRLYGEF